MTKRMCAFGDLLRMWYSFAQRPDFLCLWLRGTFPLKCSFLSGDLPQLSGLYERHPSCALLFTSTCSQASSESPTYGRYSFNICWVNRWFDLNGIIRPNMYGYIWSSRYTVPILILEYTTIRHQQYYVEMPISLPALRITFQLEMMIFFLWSLWTFKIYVFI